MMPVSKISVVLVLALALVAKSVEAQNKTHSLIIGSRQNGDRLIYTENISKPSSLLKVEVKKTFNVPNHVITQVSALDMQTDGNGATATWLGGGNGYDKITLKFKSQRGHGINFRVEIYGKSSYV